MFWNKKPDDEEEKKPAAAAPEPPTPEPPTDPLQTASEDLAQSLMRYENAFRRTVAEQPDPDLEAAKEKVRLAEKLLRDSGLKQHIPIVLDAIIHWPAWSKRDDFEEYNDLRATSVLAESVERKEKHRSTEVSTISFSFNEQDWTFIFEDQGYSSVPGDAVKIGSLELLHQGQRVFASSLSRSFQDYSIWEIGLIRALKVGDWMKGVAEMSVVGEQNRRKQAASFRNRLTLEAAKNIDL